MNNQTIKLVNRESVEISNAKKVISFNPNEFLIESSYGNLKVLGKNLSIGRMDTDKEELCIKGYIDKIEYLGKSSKDEKKEGIFTKLFK